MVYNPRGSLLSRSSQPCKERGRGGETHTKGLKKRERENQRQSDGNSLQLAEEEEDRGTFCGDAVITGETDQAAGGPSRRPGVKLTRSAKLEETPSVRPPRLSERARRATPRVPNDSSCRAGSKEFSFSFSRSATRGETWPVGWGEEGREGRGGRERGRLSSGLLQPREGRRGAGGGIHRRTPTASSDPAGGRGDPPSPPPSGCRRFPTPLKGRLRSLSLSLSRHRFPGRRSGWPSLRSRAFRRGEAGERALGRSGPGMAGVGSRWVPTPLPPPPFPLPAARPSAPFYRSKAKPG